MANERRFTLEPDLNNQDKYFYIAADIGAVGDYTAIVIIESKVVDSGKLDAFDRRRYINRMDVVEIIRYRDVELPDIAEHLRQLKADPRLKTYEYSRQTTTWTWSYPEVIVDRT